LLEECREIYERFVLFAEFHQRFDTKLTECRYEWTYHSNFRFEKRGDERKKGKIKYRTNETMKEEIK